MPTLDELKAKLERISREAPEKLLDVATVVSLTGKALAERTIKDKGFGETYSQNPIPVWFFSGKELNQKGNAYIEEKQGRGKKKKKGQVEFDGLGTWEEFRAAQGLQTKHVDLTFSGKMFAGMFPQEPYQSGTLFIAPLGHNNREGQDTMNWNQERYGDFVGKVLRGENFDAMANVAVDEIMRILIEPNL